MKKLLIQPCVLAVVALSMLGFGCSPDKVIVQRPSVDIQLVEELLPTSFTAKFTPEEGTARYDYGFGTKEDLESFKDGSLPSVTNVATAEITQHTFTEEVEDIKPNTEYFIFARAFDASDNPGDVAMCSVKTIKDDFKASLSYVTDVSAGFTVETSEDYGSYYCALVSPDEVATFMANPTSIDSSREINNDYLQTYNWFTLEPETDYVFVVKGWDRASLGDPKEFAIPITTFAEGSDEFPNFTIKQTDADFAIQNYVVTPNELCGKLLLRQELKDYKKDLYEGAHNGNYMKVFDSWQGIDVPMMKCYTATGEILNADPDLEAKDMGLGVALDVYVVVYDDTLPLPVPCGVKKYTNFSTPERDMMLDKNTAKVLKAEIDMKTLTSSYVDVSIEVNEDTRMFLYEIYDESAYTKRTTGTFNKYTTFQDELFNMYKNGNVGFGYRTTTYKNFWSGEKGEIKPGGIYYLVVAPMNANGPVTDGWGEIFSYKFAVPADVKD